MSINSGQPSLSSSSSSIKLVQQHVKSFIQNLSSQELLLLLETFNQSHQINRSCKMVQYKCFESKIELDGKIGCGFGRSQEEAIAMSVKDFFDVILLEDKYLYLVQECFKQMKTQQQKEQIKQHEPIQQQGILSEKVEDSQRNQQSQQNLKQLSDIEPSNNINFDDDNITRLLISSSLAEIEGTNEESQYMSGHDELQRKIGNISVINAGNAISSQATNNNINNSHADIDEMLLKIVFGEDNKNNKEDIKGNQNNIQPIKNKQIISKTNNPPICSSPPLTQFQIYQMQQLQLQQQQQQQQSNSKSNQLFPQYYNQIITKKSSMQTPPRKRHFSSSSGCNTFNNTNTQSTVPQQLNDTAFLPINKKTTTTTNNMNPSKTNQQLIQTNQIQPLQIENKENAFAVNQQIVNKQQFSNTISTCSGQLSRNNSKNQLARDVYSSEQAQGVSGISNPQHQLSVCRGNSSCCSHKEDLDRERQKTENLEKRIKLLMEENKILKSLLFDNEENVKGNNYSSCRNNQNINQGITQDIMLISKEKVSEDKGSNSDKPDNKNEKYGRSQSYGPTNLKGNKIAQQPGNNNNTSSNSNSNSISINVAQSQQNQTQNKTIDSQFVFDQQSQMNISSQNPLSSVKKPIPKLNLEVLPNYHGKIVFKNLSNKQGNIMCNSESH